MTKDSRKQAVPTKDQRTLILPDLLARVFPGAARTPRTVIHHWETLEFHPANTRTDHACGYDTRIATSKPFPQPSSALLAGPSRHSVKVKLHVAYDVGWRGLALSCRTRALELRARAGLQRRLRLQHPPARPAQDRPQSQPHRLVLSRHKSRHKSRGRFERGPRGLSARRR